MSGAAPRGRKAVKRTGQANDTNHQYIRLSPQEPVQQLMPRGSNVKETGLVKGVPDTPADIAGQESGASAGMVVGMLAPTEAVLLDLRERFISAFGYPREDSSQISGKDLHSEQTAPITESKKPRSAVLRLETENGYKITTLARLQDTTSETTAYEATALMRRLWPDAGTGQSKLHMIGPRFDRPEGLEYALFNWLASHDAAEGFWSRRLALRPGGPYLPYTGQHVCACYRYLI
jgi:hypothetical protein